VYYSVLQCILSHDRQWKHKEFAMELVAFLQRNDLDPTVQEVALFSRSLIDDAVSVRKV